MGFFDNFPYYYLIISAVVCGSFVWIFFRATKWHFNQRLILDLGLFTTVIGFLGARLAHVIYEYPEYYAENPWRFFDFGRGGYVYYGSLLTGFMGGWLFLRFRKAKPILRYFDFAAPVLSLGYALGRLACLASGCCYGPIVDGNWGMSIADENGIFHHHHPTPLYSTFFELMIFSFLIYGERKKIFRTHGSEFFIWLLLHSLTRFILEFWRADYRGPIYLFSISGWISIFLFSVAMGGLLRLRKII